ncbi:MAG: hypothetical protein R3D56_05080 [Paracoccaceae bacterium]
MTKARSPPRCRFLDEPPLSLLSKSDQPVDLAEGRAELTSVLKFVPKPKLTVAEVAFDVSGTLRDVRSDRIVPGHLLEGAALTIAADNEGMSIGGAARTMTAFRSKASGRKIQAGGEGPLDRRRQDRHQPRDAETPVDHAAQPRR